MVYETLLGEKKLQLNKEEGVNERINKIKELINVGKKAYGANHIAAFLFRKDYNLWVRAADIAYQISLYHDGKFTLPFIHWKVSFLTTYVILFLPSLILIY